MNEKKKIEKIRADIDSLDKRILDLISDRAGLAQEIAKIKMTSSESFEFYRPEREAQILRKIIEHNKGPLSEEEMARLFREIMSACLTGSNLGIEASSFANDQGGPPSTGQFFIAINPEKFSSSFEEKVLKIIRLIESQEKARVPGSKRINSYKTNINNEISIKEELYDKIISLNQ